MAPARQDPQQDPLPWGTSGLQVGSASSTEVGEGKSHSEHVQHSQENLAPSSRPRLCCLSHGLRPLSHTGFLRSIAKGRAPKTEMGASRTSQHSAPATRLEGVRVPCGEWSSKTVFSIQPRPSGEHPQERDGPRGARHPHSEQQQQALGMSFGALPSHGSLLGLPPRGQVPRSQVWFKSNRTFSRSSPSSRLRSPPSPGRIPPAPRH